MSVDKGSNVATSLCAFETLYRRHFGFVVTAAKRLGVATPHLDDAAQEVFLVAFRRLPDATSNLRPWLYSVTRRVASNYRRAAKRSARKHGAAGELAREARPGPKYEAVLAIDDFLRTLPRVDRELFVLSEIEGLTGREVAEALDLKLSTAYARLKALQAKLHEGLDPSVAHASVARCRSQRPRANARGWAAISSLLAPSAKASWLATAGLCIAATVGGTAIGFARSPATSEASGPPRAHAAAARPRGVPVPPPPGAPAEAGILELDPRTDARPLVPREVSTTPRRSASKAVLPSSEMPIAEDSLALQTRSLAAASRALRDSDPQGALQQLEASADLSWAASPLADGRAALRIEALCALDRQEDARHAATEFADAFPNSGLDERLSRTCVGSFMTTPDLSSDGLGKPSRHGHLYPR